MFCRSEPVVIKYRTKTSLLLLFILSFFQSLFFFFSGRHPLYRRHKDIFAFIGADLIFWATKAFTCWEQWPAGSAWFGAVRSDNRTCHRKVNPSLKKRLMVVQFYVFFLTLFPSCATVKGKILRFYCAHDFVHRDDQMFSVLNSKSRGRDWAKRASTAMLIVGQDSSNILSRFMSRKHSRSVLTFCQLVVSSLLIVFTNLFKAPQLQFRSGIHPIRNNWAHK